MIVKITQHTKKDLHNTSKRSFVKDSHYEVHIITTIWLFFLPIWTFKKLKASQL